MVIEKANAKNADVPDMQRTRQLEWRSQIKTGLN